MEDRDVIEAMQTYGGGFVHALAEAALRADVDNLKRIKATWPEYWKQYTELAEKAQKAPLSGKGGQNGEKDGR